MAAGAKLAFGASEIADVATVQDPQRAKIEMPTRAPKDTRLSDADPLTQALLAKSLLVTSYGMDFMSYAEMLDTTPNASEHLKVAFVEQCVDGYRASLARWAICKAADGRTARLLHGRGTKGRPR